MIISCSYGLGRELLVQTIPNWVNLADLSIPFDSRVATVKNLDALGFNIIVSDEKSWRQALQNAGVDYILVYKSSGIDKTILLSDEEQIDIAKYGSLYDWVNTLMDDGYRIKCRTVKRNTKKVGNSKLYTWKVVEK